MLKRHVFHLSMRPKRRPHIPHHAAFIEEMNEPLLDDDDNYSDEGADDGRHIVRVRTYYLFSTCSS